MHIHIADLDDNNVRMILPPTSGGQADVVYTYTVSGLGDAGGMTFDGTHVHIADFADNNVRMILPPTSGGQADVVYTYTVSGLGTPTGMAFDGTHIHIADSDDDNVRMILPPTANGQASIVRTYTVSGVRDATGMAFDGTHIHIVDVRDDNVRMILPPTAGGQADVVRTYTVSGLNSPQGMTFDGTHVHITDTTDDNVRMILPPTSGGQADVVYTYTVSGVGGARGITFDGGGQATLTLSTDDTDIRAGEAVDINIASDIDIENFVASDITVTGGTRGALTETAADDYTLRVTAGSAGTMTVSIAEDAVDPGNAAASQDFTVNARVTPTITFDDTEGESGGSTGVNIAFSESVTGLLLSHLTASEGTLSNLTGSGTSWEADLAFPDTGSGTVDIDLAIDSTTPQNAAASASIDYAEAADPVLIEDRLYFISTASDATSIAHAYDFDGNRQSDDDIAIGAGFWQGGLASDTYIYFVSNGGNVGAAYDFYGDRQAAQDISLDSNSWQAAVSSDTRLYFVSDSTNTAVAYDFDGNRQSGDDISLGGGGWAATSRSDDRLYFVNNSVNIARAYDFDGNRQASDDITLTTGAKRGGLRSDTRLYFVSGSQAQAYDYSGTRQSGDDIELGTGRWQGGTTIFAEQVDAVLDITAASQDIEGGASTDVTFSFDIAVTDFDADDVDLDVGTKGTLTDNGDNTFTMPVTAPTTGDGDMTVSVAADVVSPGNNADSVVIAYTEPDAVLDISLSPTSVETGEDVDATFTFDKAITNFVAADVSLTGGGTKGTLTDNGDNTFSMPITAPTTGDGTITVSVAADAVDPGNNTDSADFTYAEPDADLSFGIKTIANQAWVVDTAITSVTLPEATGGEGTITYSLSPTLPSGVRLS